MQDEKVISQPIKRIDKVSKLLEPNERKISTCYFCGIKGKAAYKVDITDTNVSPVSFKGSCCRRCMNVIPRKTVV